MSRPFGLSRVPVIPNASQVHGRVERVEADPDGRGSVWTLNVAQAEDVPGYPNFVQDRVGQSISVFVPRGTAADVGAHDRVTARIAFRGDERGGLFAVVDDDVQKH